MPLTYKLIHAVERRPTLWKTYQDDVFQLNLQTDLWKEIATSLGEPDHKIVKRKWESLVDHYHEELKKIVIKRVGEVTTCSYDSSWPYFKAMSFMKNAPMKLSPNSRVSPPDSPHSKPNAVFDSNELDSVNHGDIKNHIISNVRTVADPIISNVSTTANPIITNIRTIDDHMISGVQNVDNHIVSEVTSVDNHIISNVASVNNHIISNVRSLSCPLPPVTNSANMMLIPNQNVLDTNFCDSDFFFLRSLIPDLKSLPAHRKMFVKLKFQEVLYSEIMQLQRESSTAGTIEIFGVSDVNSILP